MHCEQPRFGIGRSRIPAVSDSQCFLPASLSSFVKMETSHSCVSTACQKALHAVPMGDALPTHPTHRTEKGGPHTQGLQPKDR